jgi:DNA modification methylase
LNSETDAKQAALDVDGKAVVRLSKKRAQQLTLSGEPEKKSHPDPRNRLNNLPNKEWMYFTRSVWFTSFPRELEFELRGRHGGNKPPSLLKEIIQFFTKKDETVLDPMSGVGGTLLGASLCDRQAKGIEINDAWTRIYEQVCRKHHIEPFEVTSGDCLEVMSKMKGHVDLIVVDPPYRESTFNPNVSGVRKQAIANGDRMTSLTDSFSKDKRDFGNSSTYEEYQTRLGSLFRQCYRVLAEGRYLIVFSKDEFRDGAYFELSSEMARLAVDAGFKWVGKISWIQAGAPLRPYGLPFTYVPNFIDQKILVMKKGNGGV